MLRWLQTSLFGPIIEAERSAGDASPAAGSTPASAWPVGSEDAAFHLRWKAATEGEDIALTLAPRLRQGWRLSWRRGGGAVLRAPRLFRDAPDDILRALGAWARLAMRRKSPARVAERRALEKLLHGWIEAHQAQDAKARKLREARDARRLERLQPKGRYHDLDAVLARVLSEYFAAEPGMGEIRITWSRRWGGLSTQTMARDAEGKPYPLISISRAYDHSSATPEIVGGVVYHECLHVAVPPEEKDGRRVVHGREFRRREKLYRHYAEWRRWHAEKLPRIVVKMRNEK